jgi:FHS family L-fucose permease-like MFS transporter
LQQASSIKLPYLALGLIAIALGIAIATFKLPPVPAAERHGDDRSASTHLWKYRHLILGAVGIFVYVGAEVSIGSFMVNYLSQPNIGNLPEKIAAGYLSFYWGGAMVGRFIGAAILQKIRTGVVLGGAGIATCLLLCVSMLSAGPVAMWSIILVGLFNSIMFPSIFTLGIAELGPLTGEGSGIMIMAIVGGAIVPVLVGVLADRIGIHHSFILPLICYFYIVYYGFKGSQPVRTA